LKQGKTAQHGPAAQVAGRLFDKKSGLKNSCHDVDGIEKTVLEFKAQLIAASRTQDRGFAVDL
jgi:hypothetical protein